MGSGLGPSWIDTFVGGPGFRATSKGVRWKVTKPEIRPFQLFIPGKTVTLPAAAGAVPD